MLDVKRGLVLLSGALVLSGCEFIAITPDRVDEGAPGTVTVSEVGAITDECVDEEVTVFYFDEETSTEVILGTVTAGAAGENWSVDVPAPTERGSYLIQSRCGDSGSVFPEELIVQPPFAPTADPSSYVVGSEPDAITVTGDFCISSSFLDGGPIAPIAVDEEEPQPSEVPLPTVVGVLGAEELTAEASELQPFDETWTLEFTAPTTPGTHTIDIGCSYLDYVSGSFGGIPVITGPGTALGVTADSHEEPQLPPFVTEEVASALVAVQVDGILEIDSAEVDEGDSVTATNADSSPCAGTVTVQVLDGETVVDSAAPAVAEDGTWSATFDDLAAGAYTVVAECIGAEEAGNFSYEPVVLSVAGVQPTTTTTTTTTTTVPSGNVAADSATPVRAQPAFTG